MLNGKAERRNKVIEIKDYKFDPAEIVIEAGDWVTWKNMNSEIHTIEFEDGEMGEATLEPGEIHNQRFMIPGTYVYNSTLFPGMKGRIIVGE